MSVALILVLGLICGFLSSSPPGTINLWLINQTLHSRKESNWFLFGIVIADCGYAAIAAWGYHTLIEGTAIETAMLVLAAVCILFLGATTLFKKNKEIDKDFTISEKPWQQLTMGLIMCGGNPAFLVFWIFAVGVLQETFGIYLEEFFLLLFIFGIVIGDYLWFSFLINLVKKFRQKITSKYVLLINKVTGITFLVIGSLALIELLG
jgi:threonine/homoserine/homoserine lactone efflux protein